MCYFISLSSIAIYYCLSCVVRMSVVWGQCVKSALNGVIRLSSRELEITVQGFKGVKKVQRLAMGRALRPKHSNN